MMTTTNFKAAANATTHRPEVSYTCHWCKAFNRAGYACGCGKSRWAALHRGELKAINVVPAPVDLDSIEITI